MRNSQSDHVYLRAIQGFSSGGSALDCLKEIGSIAQHANFNRSGTVIGNHEVSYYPTGFIIQCPEDNLKTISLYDAGTGFRDKEGTRNESQDTKFFSSVGEMKSALPPLTECTHRENNLPPGVRIYNEIEFKEISKDMVAAIYYTSVTPAGIIESGFELIDNELKAIALQHACCREFTKENIPILFYDPQKNTLSVIAEKIVNPNSLLEKWVDAVRSQVFFSPESQKSDLLYLCKMFNLDSSPYLSRLYSGQLEPNINYEPTYALNSYRVCSKYNSKVVVDRAVDIVSRNENNRWALNNVLFKFPDLRSYAEERVKANQMQQRAVQDNALNAIQFNANIAFTAEFFTIFGVLNKHLGY